MSELYPLFGDLTIGGVGGFCVGYATKKLFKIIAFVCGAGFISLQCLARAGIISIHYNALWGLGEKLLSKISVYGSSLGPMGLGFAGGVYLGLKQG